MTADKEIIELLSNTPSSEEYEDSIVINLKVRGTPKSLFSLVKYIKDLEKELKNNAVVRPIRKSSKKALRRANI